MYEENSYVLLHLLRRDLHLYIGYDTQESTPTHRAIPNLQLMQAKGPASFTPLSHHLTNVSKTRPLRSNGKLLVANMLTNLAGYVSR